MKNIVQSQTCASSRTNGQHRHRKRSIEGDDTPFWAVDPLTADSALQH